MDFFYDMFLSEAILMAVFVLGVILVAYILYHVMNLDEKVRFESYIEERLYKALIKEGYNVKTQVNCGYYYIDLTLPRYKIAIECDGEAYHSSRRQKMRDAKRTAYLRRNGWKSVLRFKGKDIINDLDGCIKRINAKVGAR